MSGVAKGSALPFVTYGMRNLKEGAKFRESIKKLLA
jgi:UTP--glucose-1-phosphate uridylyltransferase